MTRLPRLARHRQAAALGIVVLTLATAIRFYTLDRPFFYTDEAFSWRAASRPLEQVFEPVGGDTHPPGHFVLLKFWMAVWGDSPEALRGLSVLCGVLCVPLVYLLVMEAGCNARSPPHALRGGALFTAALVAIHLAQVAPGRTARMYSLGALLAGVSAYLLLRALRAPRPARWWVAYGISAAAFCYTHNYAFYTIAAQALFVAGLLLSRGLAASPPKASHPLQAVAPSALGFLSAGLLALALYSPWLPVFLNQSRRVRESFWVRDLSLPGVRATFMQWFAGYESAAPTDALLCLGLLAAVSLWMMLRRDAVGLFFLSQAVVPWLLTIAVSTWGERPLLQLRYLTFAQLSLLALWGVAFARLRSVTLRILFAAVLLVPSADATWTWLRQLPSGPPAMLTAVRYLDGHHRQGDVILVQRYAHVNCMRFYAKQVGMSEIDVRCQASAMASPGHTNHISSLDRQDMFIEIQEVTATASRVWVAGTNQSSYILAGQPGWTRKGEYRFASPDHRDHPEFFLTLFVRKCE